MENTYRKRYKHLLTDINTIYIMKVNYAKKLIRSNCMKNILVLLTALTALISGPAFALEGEIGVSSDYMWRGMSQTDGKPALNIGAWQDVGKGFYVGAWASNVDFNDDTKIEYDLYGGYAFSKGDFNLDVGYMSYRYDGDDVDRNFEESYLELGYGPVTVGHQRDSDNSSVDYNYLDVNLPFINFADVTLHYGDYDGVKDKAINVEYALSDSMKLGLLVQSNVRHSEVDFGDAVSVHMSYSF